MVEEGLSEGNRGHHENCEAILERAVRLYRRVRGIKRMETGSGDESTKGAYWNEKILEKFNDGDSVILGLANFVRGEQNAFLKVVWERIRKYGSEEEVDRLQKFEKDNRTLNTKLLRRLFAQENEDLIFTTGKDTEGITQQFHLMEQEWRKSAGPLKYFLSDEENARIASCYATARGHETNGLRLFATDPGEENSEELIEGWAMACFRTSLYRHILDYPEEEWDYNKSVSYWDKLLDNRLHYDIEHSRAEEMLKLFDRLNWGPDRFVQSEAILGDVYDRLNRQNILIFQGFGAIGKTALANKVILDSIDKKEGAIEPFERYKYFSSKVNSDQGTLYRGEIVSTDVSMNIGEALGRGGVASADRLRGSARQIWLGIVGLFESTDERDHEDDLRRKSIEKLKNHRVLVIIDNFEDFQNPLVHRGEGDDLSEAMEETVRKEYVAIVGWLEELWKLGRDMNSRVIVTRRSKRWGQAVGRNADLPEIPGDDIDILSLRTEEAFELLRTAIQSQIDGREDLIERCNDVDVKRTLEESRNRLRRALQEMQDHEIKGRITKHLKTEWSDGAAPQMIIDGAVHLTEYEGEGVNLLMAMLNDFKEGNKYTEAYYNYSTKKSLGTLYNNEAYIKFIKGLLKNESWVSRGFTINHLTYRKRLLNGDPDETEMFLLRLRLSYWIRSEDREDGRQWWLWKPQIAKSLCNQLEVQTHQEDGEELDLEGVALSLPPLSEKQRKVINIKKGWLERWQNFLEDQNDFSEPGGGDYWLKNPEGTVDASQNSILGEISRESESRSRLVDFLRVDNRGLDEEQYVYDVGDCAWKTMERLEEASKNGGVGLWAEYVKTQGSSRVKMLEESLLAEAIAGLMKIWNGVFSELWKRAHEGCTDHEICKSDCRRKRHVCYGLTRDYLQKFSTVVDICNLENNPQIEQVRLDTLFLLAPWSARVASQNGGS